MSERLQGDRVWDFAVSLVLVKIGGNVRLVAINGLVAGLAVMALGPIVGRWIDRFGRLAGSQPFFNQEYHTYIKSHSQCM